MKRHILSGASALLFLARLASAQEPADNAPPPPPPAAPLETSEPPPAAEPTPEIPTDEAVVASQEAAMANPAGRRLTSVVSFDVGGYIDTQATTVLTPSIGGVVSDPLAGWSVNGRYLVDMVSAASPDIVATASPNWKEVRNAGNIGGRYKPGNFGVAGGASVSYTNDYLALGFNGQLIQDLDDKNLTLTESYTFGHDVIGRTGTPFSVFARQFDYHAISLAASRVVNPTLVLGVTADLVIERGDQSKPYRYIPIFDGASATRVNRGESADRVSQLRVQARPLEQLPLQRERGAITGRASWRVTSRSTIRAEERLYQDTWNLRSTTTDVRWLFDVSDRIMVWPHGRFHVQNGADFWQRAYSARNVHDLPALRTGDRELSPLNNITFGGGTRIGLGKRSVAGKSLDDVVINAGADATRTYFNDAMYVSERWSVLLTTGIEVSF